MARHDAEHFDPAGHEVHNPVDRFAHLPEPTREWLEQLREDDINEIREAVQFMHSAKTVGKFTKWLIISVVGCFVGVVALGEAIQKFLDLIGLWRRH